MTFVSRHISISINKTAKQVYDFVSDPANLPQWAAGLSASIKKVGQDWIAESPMGTVKVKFAEKNDFGILDHNVTLPSGETVYNPMRAFPNDNGCEVVFTLYKLPGVTEEQYTQDGKLVEIDLVQLKHLMEEKQ
ncbi:hypothetical protein LS482_03200 [Sinomicrobium kalidii]|uniref:hypothetical protein n=1 Tax=Sinomicrobium kalidii TaxID=2900738 RepID=UPI001E2E7F4D|nr:hypothetical protein [Sinomicrobium kalidii]UGU16886.1 hypothetical protein LS482_03200 [Sinomicrobium kalidii]